MPFGIGLLNVYPSKQDLCREEGLGILWERVPEVFALGQITTHGLWAGPSTTEVFGIAQRVQQGHKKLHHGIYEG